MKKCKRCNIEKDEINFSKNRQSPDGLCNWCKLCISEYRKEYSILNADKISKDKKEYYQENKEYLIGQAKNYYQEHKEEKKEYDKNRYYADVDASRQTHREYYYNNKEVCIERTTKYSNLQYKTNPVFKLRNRVSCEIKRALKKVGSSKMGHSVLEYLPYTIQELKEHLENQFEPWMNWDNHGKYDVKTWNDTDQTTWTWNMDHIIPQADLLYSSMEEENFQRCWALENLRPLSAKQNILDGTQRKRHKNG
jgi:hypothetical protein